MSVGLAASVDAFARGVVRKLAGLTEIQDHQESSLGVAVAYSGGLDSSVLLHLVHQFCVDRQIPFFAFHVHHGLSPNADDWAKHCAAECARLDIAFEMVQVEVKQNGEGIEAAARDARYAALGSLCQKFNASLLLTAHHLDDQAETLLMQLLRGSGPRGLCGMDDSNYAPDLLKNSSLMMARPLLQESRKQLEMYAQLHALSYVIDESNEDLRYTRNAIRHQLMPQLELIAPQFSHRFARSASHIRAANRMLDELAQSDLQVAQTNNGLEISILSQLSSDRIDNLLRYWLSMAQVQMPSTSKLNEMRKQLFSARDDARIQIHHLDFTLSRYDGRIHLIPLKKHDEEQASVRMIWAGQSELAIPEMDGRLIFEESGSGIDYEQLIDKEILVKKRVSGMRLRLGKNRPSRDMKSHFQSARIPFWRRSQLPFVFLDDRLLFVAELGMDASFLSEGPGKKIQLSWKANA